MVWHPTHDDQCDSPTRIRTSARAIAALGWAAHFPNSQESEWKCMLTGLSHRRHRPCTSLSTKHARDACRPAPTTRGTAPEPIPPQACEKIADNADHNSHRVRSRRIVELLRSDAVRTQDELRQIGMLQRCVATRAGLTEHVRAACRPTPRTWETTRGSFFPHKHARRPQTMLTTATIVCGRGGLLYASVRRRAHARRVEAKAHVAKACRDKSRLHKACARCMPPDAKDLENDAPEPVPPQACAKIADNADHNGHRGRSWRIVARFGPTPRACKTSRGRGTCCKGVSRQGQALHQWARQARE